MVLLKLPAPGFVCHEGQTRWDGGRRSSLCGCKLLGLCPDPLLIVHPVLTETRKRQGEVFHSRCGYLRVSTHTVRQNANLTPNIDLNRNRTPMQTAPVPTALINVKIREQRVHRTRLTCS